LKYHHSIPESWGASSFGSVTNVSGED